jgi:O-antigen/teichoic acid export membrane protein
MSGALPAPLTGPFSHSLSLCRNLPWAVSAEMVYAASQWGMVAALAKLGTPEIVGQFALAFAVTAPLFMFANLQLRALLASDWNTEGGFSPYFTLRLLGSALALLAIAGIAWLTNFPSEMKTVIMLVGLFKAVEAVSDIFHGELQRFSNMKWICLSLVLRGVITLAALALGIYWTQHLAPACLAMASACLLVLLGIDAPSVARSSLNSPFPLCRDLHSLKRLLLLAWPLGLVALLISLNVSIPRYFLESYWGAHALGIYSALASLVQASTLLSVALGASASGRLGYRYAARDRLGWGRMLNRLSGLSLLFGVGGLVVALFGGPILLTFFYSSEYAAYQRVFCLLMLAAVGTNVCFIMNWAVVAARYINVQLPFQLLLLFVTTAACYVLIPSFGLLGAAWSVGITSGCQVLGNVFILRHAARSLENVTGGEG